ncbi:hypothetical protein [Mycoplasma sp. HU2014]|uniref:hypothetical protein n=1 Tax=Mycoplasma sp. HU2014 TaxID=1664275 RepID=UPI000B117419|nr:hypothetical protein [Mycoplasma sp. HU2014]
MKNLASIVSKSVDLDKDVMKSVAAYRSVVVINNDNMSTVATQLDITIRGLNLQIENYFELQALQ